MIFTEHRFFLFFATVWAVHWVLRSQLKRKVFLLLASYAFYAAWDWRFLSLIWLSTLTDYGLALAMDGEEDPGRRRLLLRLSLAVNLGLLGVFKYLGFFVESAAEVLNWFGWEAHPPSLRWILPAGISFYTFQTLSYTLDVYGKKQRAHRSLLDVALFVGFFPQLVAGPIVRSREFLPQLQKKAAWSEVPVRLAVWMFLVGYFKKACVSDNIHLLVDAFYADPLAYSRWDALLAAQFFNVQLYCDFSGYSDMAIACATLLGYRLPMNFHFPYLASDYTQLMNRWHMTLSRWVRDYVYLPWVGTQRSVWVQLRCLAGTMFLVGLWHGADWHFVVWGLGMGLGAAIHRAWNLTGWSGRLKGKTGYALGWALTFSYMTAMLVLFRAPSTADAWRIFGAWWGQGTRDLQSFGAGGWVVLVGLAGLHVAFFLFKPERKLARLPSSAFAVLMGVSIPLCLTFARADVQPFLYFQF